MIPKKKFRILKMHDTIEFWKGDFGNAYSERNKVGTQDLANRIKFWTKVLDKIKTKPQSILEVGCNVGINLQSLRHICDYELFAIEPNQHAREKVVQDGTLDIDHLFDATADQLPFKDEQFDLVFTSGVLIHINPSNLESSMREIHRVSKKFIFCCEYFSDRPVEVDYRGHGGVLFKRDFGSMYMEMFPELNCIDYGFEWNKVTGLDNLTWWLFSK
jgi:spore coat polysaccharide biosynthesis protein SpsF